MSEHTNRLIDQASPYLLQHAHNPVDWYPWGEEALGRAREQDRPILLSIGYSACHWCHVMAHESFEDPAIAGVMNEHFINIKVDREERPDLDQIYMTVCQLVTGAGGWPLTVFLTPDQEPFFAGTYFPPEQRYGRPGFKEILLALAEAYREARAQVADKAGQILAELHRQQSLTGDGVVGEDILERAYPTLLANFDRVNGGFGGEPKFPNPFNLELFLRHHARSGEAEPLRLTVEALRAMRRGGIYDQIGHGFHRYSVDAEWRVPHFEKMLYDNALLPPLYLAAAQATGEPDLAATARETLDYLLSEMRHPDGAFYSTSDADSEGEEGRFFVWTPEQVHEVLEQTRAALICERFGITRRGNFEHQTTVLNIERSVAELAAGRGLTPQHAGDELEQGRRSLLEARAHRSPPFRDEKILTAWNGLAVSAFAQAGRLLAVPRYLAAARAAARFVLDHLAVEGLLHRVYKDGKVSVGGYLDDYGAMINGLLDLFCTTGEPDWYHRAAAFAETALRQFRDPAQGDFYMTAENGESLVLRPKELHDGATPSGTSLIAHALVRLHQLTGDEGQRRAVDALFAAQAETMRGNTWGTANLIAALDRHLAEPRSVVVAGDGEAADALLKVAVERYDPNLVICRRRPEVPDAELPALLHERQPLSGRPAAYLCRGFACDRPVTSPDELREQLWGRE